MPLVSVSKGVRVNTSSRRSLPALNSQLSFHSSQERGKRKRLYIPRLTIHYLLAAQIRCDWGRKVSSTQCNLRLSTSRLIAANTWSSWATRDRVLGSWLEVEGEIQIVYQLGKSCLRLWTYFPCQQGVITRFFQNRARYVISLCLRSKNFYLISLEPNWNHMGMFVKLLEWR